MGLEVHTGGVQSKKLEEAALEEAIGSYTRLELPLEYRYLVFEFANVFPLVCVCHLAFHSVIQERGVRLPSGFPLEVEVPGDHIVCCLYVCFAYLYYA